MTPLAVTPLKGCKLANFEKINNDSGFAWFLSLLKLWQDIKKHKIHLELLQQTKIKNNKDTGENSQKQPKSKQIYNKILAQHKLEK